MDKTTQKIKQLRPIDKTKATQGCCCYSHWDSRADKPIRIVVDSDSRLVYCDHCGNIIDPFMALQLLCRDWDRLQKASDDIKERLRRAWEIGRKYRPWKRAIKDLEKQIGRRGENQPCCPHCHQHFKIEDITEFRCFTPDGHSFGSSGHRLGRFESIYRG